MMLGYVRCDVPRANASRRRIGPDQVLEVLPSACGAQQSDDLALFRMASELGLLEQRNSVSGHFESATGAGYELDVRIGKLIFELGRQPDGPGLVASNGAVFDRDLHGGLMCPNWSIAVNIARTATGCAASEHPVAPGLLAAQVSNPAISAG